MATPLSHAVVAYAMTRVYADRKPLPWGFTASALFCAVIPDIDVLGLKHGVPYGSLWGHRGLSHSFLAAAVLGLIVSLAWLKSARTRQESFLLLWLFFFLVTASHGILDAMTDGGLGVALFSPFNLHRYFLDWRPIRVAPISLSAYAHPHGWAVLASEMRWIWIPSAVVIVWSFCGSGRRPHRE